MLRLANGVKEKIRVENNREIVNKMCVFYFHRNLRKKLTRFLISKRVEY